MTKQEAMQLLDKAPCAEMPSRINRGITQKQAVAAIRAWVVTASDDGDIVGLMEKRVWQVHKNQRRPRY